MKLMRVFIFVFALLLAIFQGAGGLRMVVIGDSVDRFMVEDWCVRHRGRLITQAETRVNNATDPVVSFLHHRFKDHGARHNAWEFRVCHSAEYRVNVSFVMNKCGVRTNPPYWTPIRTMAGVEKELRSSMSVRQTVDISIGPALRALATAEVLGGHVHAVLLQSNFWDLSVLRDTMLDYGYDPRVTPPDYVAPEPLGASGYVPPPPPPADVVGRWVDGWGRNASHLMAAVRHCVRADAYFWRESTDFSLATHGAWNDDVANATKLLMDVRAWKETERSGYELIPVSRVSDHRGIRRRDMLHPSVSAAVALFQYELRFIRSRIPEEQEQGEGKGEGKGERDM
jgi:hypothetical protein